MTEKYNQRSIAIPIPFALSLVNTLTSIAIEEKIKESETPIERSIMPFASGENKIIISPDPIKNDIPKEMDNPKYKLSQIDFRFIGWLKINSMNSVLL
jgi:hypothetical protein